MTKRPAKSLVLFAVVACGSPDRPADNPKNAIEVPMQPAAPPSSAPPADPPPIAVEERKPEASDVVDPTAPFGMEQATAGLAGSGALVATIKTNHGDLTCRLFADKAPLAVANFVGLARGVRPWKSPD